jgi:hypothetical protein
MSIATSLFLIAAGAVLRFAVTVNVAGIDLQVVGLILMIVGILGLIISIGFMVAQSSDRKDAAVPPRSPREQDPYR